MNQMDATASRGRGRRLRAMARGAIAIFAFTLLFVWIAGIARLDLDSPLVYDGDALEAMANFEHAYIFNDYHTRLQAPFEIARDTGARYVFNAIFQSSSNLTWLTWLIAGGNDVCAFNLAFLATFLLVFASAYWVLGRLRLENPYRFCAATMYALMPYHFQRGTSHFLESSYYFVPLLSLLLLRLWAARPPAHRWDETEWKFDWGRLHAVWIFLLLVSLASMGRYYEFFFACLAASTAPLAALYRRSWRPLLVGLAMAAAAVGILLVRGRLGHWISSPELALSFNGQAVSRYGEAEYYPLKLMQMILPVEGHRWRALAEVRALYDTANPLINENSTTTLGAVGACGMLVCLLLAMVPTNLRMSRLGKMGSIVLLAILFAMMGGVSSFISMASYLTLGAEHELTQTRGWNRIVVYIAFFGYFAAFWILRSAVNCARNCCFPQASRRVAAWPACALVLTFALWDAVPAPIVQTSPAHYASDRDFFSKIEAGLPAGSRIMQLPYLIHHQSGSLQPGVYYTDALRPYLNTRTLHFTYGGDANSEQALWLKKAAALPEGQSARFLCSYGFAGVLLARKMVKNPAELEHTWTDVLDAAPMQSADGNHAYFDLRPFCARQRIAPLDIARAKRDLLADNDRGIHFIDSLVFSRDIGHTEIQPNGDVNVVAGADEEGFLAYGPYETLSPGRYTATFRFFLHDAAAKGAVMGIDVATVMDEYHEAVRLIGTDVTASADGLQSLRLQFLATRRTGKVVYRLYKPQGLSARFVGVEVLRNGD